jgi:hypothetical protein
MLFGFSEHSIVSIDDLPEDTGGGAGGEGPPQTKRENRNFICGWM